MRSVQVQSAVLANDNDDAGQRACRRSVRPSTPQAECKPTFGLAGRWRPRARAPRVPVQSHVGVVVLRATQTSATKIRLARLVRHLPMITRVPLSEGNAARPLVRRSEARRRYYHTTTSLPPETHSRRPQDYMT